MTERSDKSYTTDHFTLAYEGFVPDEEGFARP
jgi:hypothetical protein